MSESFASDEGEDIESLSRYFSVRRGELPPAFMISKRVPVDVDLNSPEEELWQAHDLALRDFRELKTRVDQENLDIEELDNPKKSLLDLKVELSMRVLRSCRFCERRCGVDRIDGEKGICRIGKSARVASDFLHWGEEPELVPSYTIFFSGCIFECQFCQNWDISQDSDSGREMSIEDICSRIENKRESGAKNVNWVGGDPTPNVHTILKSLKGVETNIPSVWNSNMYLTDESMRLLLGTQDVYLTDFKYGNDECAQKFSKVSNYWDVVTRNHRIAFGDAEMIIRHLVLPNHIECCTKPILGWVASSLSEETRVNIMSQYRPVAKADEYPEIDRTVSSNEMSRAYKIARKAGLKNIVR